MEAKVKHLEFIQAAISRMAGNSFLLKGWTATLAGSLLALTFKEADRKYVLLSLLVILVFWSLDSFYLSHERRFVALYNSVRILPEAAIDFSMHTHSFGKSCRWARCAFSKSILLFYGGLLAVSLLILRFI